MTTARSTGRRQLQIPSIAGKLALRQHKEILHMLELKLLGLPELSFGGEVLAPSSKALALVCYLACQPEPVHRKALSELLWGTTSTSSVRVALSELRGLAGADDWLVTEGQLVSVKAKADVSTFEDALTIGEYETALELWNAAPDTVFLRGLEVRKAPDFLDWVELERTRLSELHTEALRGRLEALREEKQYAAALELAHDVLAKDTLNEDAHRTVIRLEYARGNSEGALRAFETLRQTLKEELGVEPLPDTLELLGEIERSSFSTGKTALVLSEPGNVPALPEKLIGREDLLGEMDAALGSGKHVLLHGFGGTGKTALAATFVKRWLESSRGDVLWLQAGDDNPEALFDAVGRAFDAQQQLSQADNFGETLGGLLEPVSLFVLDDAWNSYALAKLQEALPADLPFVVTARQRHPKLTRLDVGRLARADAVTLLSHQAQQALSDPKHADALCNLLGDHPLAVRIAGLTLHAETLTPKDLLGRIKDNPHSMKTPPEFAEEGRESVAALLATTAKTLSDQAYEALLGCGSLHTTSTTPELLALALRRNEDETEDALIELQKRGLTDRQAEAGSDVITYRLHDLVYSFARANTNLRATTMMQAGRQFLEVHKRDFEVLDAEIANVLGSVQTAQFEDTELFIEMMSQLSVGDAYYLARGHSPRSLKLLVRASETAEEAGDIEAAHYLYARLGDTYRVLYANYEASLDAYLKALELAKHLEDSHREAITLSLIAITSFHKGIENTTTLFEKAKQIAQNSGDNIALSLILQHQGYVSGYEGDWQLTRDLCLETVSVTQNLYRAKQDKTSIEKIFYALLNLGEAERKLGNFSEAVEARKKALATAVEAKNDLWQAHAYMEMGEMYRDEDEKDLAKDHLDKALQLYKANNAHAYVKRVEAFYPNA